MLAIIRIGGKQYLVSPGQKIKIEKINKKELITNWKYIKNHLDPQRRKFIEFILWPKQY